jgi:hypothetical protein
MYSTHTHACARAHTHTHTNWQDVYWPCLWISVYSTHTHTHTHTRQTDRQADTHTHTHIRTHTHTHTHTHCQDSAQFMYSCIQWLDLVTQHVYVSNYRLRFVHQTLSMLIQHSNKFICVCVCAHTCTYVRVYICAYKGWWVHPFSSASKHSSERSLSIAPLPHFLSIYLWYTHVCTLIHTRMRIHICTYVHTYNYCKYVSVRTWHICMCQALCTHKLHGQACRANGFSRPNPHTRRLN